VADQIARIAASEAWDCIREGGRVVISAPGLESSGSSRDMWSHLEWLARYPNLPSGGSAGASPASGEAEMVLITAGSNPELLDAAERARKRRVWVVGDAEIDTELSFERVGTAWPL
jgi:hypothetical protein